MINHSRSRRTLFIPAALLLASLACSLPGLVKRTTPLPETPVSSEALVSPTPALPTPTPQPLPPMVVEVDPPPGSELALDGEVTFYFNQPMDRSSVEAAIKLPDVWQGGISWKDDATLALTPKQPLSPNERVTLEVGGAARSRQGLALAAPVSYTFQSVDYLRLTHRLPEPDAADVNPTSAIVAAFNYPVVPLGAESTSAPAAFSLQPAAPGRGEWLNTSTYIFYPQPALEGGKQYTVQINPELRGVSGNPLDQPAQWSFTTSVPRLVSMEPDPREGAARLDARVVLQFNQPMDTASVEAHFSLTDPMGRATPGAFSWNETGSTLTFTPQDLLARGARYTLVLSGEAQARGGTPLGSDQRFELATMPEPGVASTSPAAGGLKQPYEAVFLYMQTPLDAKADLKEYVILTPDVPNMQVWWNEADRSIGVTGDYSASSEYTLRLLAGLPDAWGGRLAKDFIFKFRTAPLPPALLLSSGNDVLFLTPEDAQINAQATNFFNVSMALGSLPLSDFIAMISSDDPYNFRQGYASADQRTWVQPLSTALNRAEQVSLYVSPDRRALRPGLYYLKVRSPQGDRLLETVTPLVVSNVSLTFKLSPTEALVWAVDLRTNTPLANAPIMIYDSKGAALATGETDAQGVFRQPIPTLQDAYNTCYAVLGQVGDERFSLALSTWNRGANPWDYNLGADYSPPRLEGYLYTDRPIYRPGQTVYFRGIVRQAYNGRYSLPELTTLPISVYKNYSEEIGSFELPLSPYGSVHGEYALPADAQPGDYRLASKLNEYRITVSFQVAEYRKPEIDLQVKFDQEQARANEELTARVEARYFFDAPAGNLPVSWALIESPSSFELPGYQVGSEDTRWLDVYYLPAFGFATQVAQGQGSTDPEGTLVLKFPGHSLDARKKYTLEVTASDESGLPVSGRGSVEVNPAEFYIGVRPDAWIGRAGDSSGFDVLVVDWEKDPAGSRALRAEFQKVTWVRSPAVATPYGYLAPQFTPQYTLVGSTDFSTNEDGQARLAFTPPEPGSYQLDVRGDGALTQVLVWVGGSGQIIWPNLPDQRLRLTADQKSYAPGDAAQVFVPNPFGADTLALVTVERSVILDHRVESIPSGGTTLSFPLSDEDAPNVYVSVTLMGQDEQGRPDYRQGYVNLPVTPTKMGLNVSLSSEPDQAGPGDEVTIQVQVTDSEGEPVQGEFSLSAVDQAVLALAEANVPDIMPYFYGEQPLGVRTGLPLGAYALREVQMAAGGMGGGGGEAPQPFVREKFLDTAYWNAEIVTGADGRAEVSFQLPDNLTTWQVSVRGVTEDTRVGQAETSLVTTKALLIRPVAPRFFVLGDHVQLAAIVQNNTSADLTVNVGLQSSGFALDDPASGQQSVNVPAGGRARANWKGVVQDVESVDLVFMANAGDLQDAARPANGRLPVRRYTALQTYATAGVLDEGGARLESVSLPRSFDAQGGRLHVELSTSLSGAMLSALDALEHQPYECTEYTLSRLLPNLELSRALQQGGVELPVLKDRLQQVLDEGLQKLQAQQNSDGGFGWCQGGQSDAYVSGYVLFGLSHARQAGADVNESTLQRASDYLMAVLTPASMLTQGWQLDPLAFENFALAEAGSGNLAVGLDLFQLRERLTPWAQALLALTLEKLSPGSQEARTLFANLQTTAIRSASGVHWEEAEPGYQNPGTPVSTTAMVVYALAQLEPSAEVLPGALRYLVAHRGADGAWDSSYSTAWAVLAAAEVMKNSGELAGQFTFSAGLNGIPLASGQAGELGTMVTADVPIERLYRDYPNALSIQREAGSGRLYYTAALQVNRPVEEVTSRDQGIDLTRVYSLYEAACLQEATCPAVHEARAGELLKVRLTLTLKQDVYYLMVEDFIPAGSEIINTKLKTSQQFLTAERPSPVFDASNPFEEGWGWWLFNPPQVYDDRITWAADFLPAGSYQLTYYLSVLQAGEYRVIPAHAWQVYFPEVQGMSAGEVFAIKP